MTLSENGKERQVKKVKKVWKVALAQAELDVAGLAEKMDRSPSYVSRVINRRTEPKLVEVFKFFEVLGITDITIDVLCDFFGDGSILDW